MSDPARLGVNPGALTADQEDALARVTVARPFVRIELAASTVNGDPLDAGRWYRYGCGVSIGDDWGSAPCVLAYLQGGALVQESGEGGVITASANDSFGGQSASIRFNLSSLNARLASLVRPMDRLRIRVTYPGFPSWLAYDGPVRRVASHRNSGGGGWVAALQIDGAGLNWVLGAAIFNWQGFVHPSSDLLQGNDALPLAEQFQKSAIQPHIFAKAFVSAVANRAMGIRLGALEGPPETPGLRVADYVFFETDTPDDFTSWPGVAYPLPWGVVASQSGASLWQICQAVAEPVLHEFFVGYRTPTGGGDPRPTLVHRPRPFPGLPEHDGYWRALPVVKVGGLNLPGILSDLDALSGDTRPNAFHWTGMGVGDHSPQAFQAKLFWGWVSSDALVNRYGYSSHAVSTKLSPILPGSPLKDYVEFGRHHLLHYAMQEIPLSVLRTRNVEGPFLPVRPGEVLEDHSYGSNPESIVTGYVTETSFTLTGSGNAYVVSMSATVERCLRGTDAAGYPDAVRALVPDISLKSYAGQDIGDLPKDPAVESAYQPPKAAPAKPEAIPNDVYAAIKSASSRQGIPAWLIAHVLQNETGLGRNWGPAEDQMVARMKGIGQITSDAVADLQSIGYQNPDGSPFVARDRGDVTKCIHATAAFLKRCQGLLEAQPGGFPPSGESYYSWVARAYRWGAASARTFGASVEWRWPAAGEAFPDYGRYWSPDAIKKAMAVWGWLG